MPILPFYRIYFDDGTFFDYDGDPVSTREQIKRLAPEDLEGYEAFHEQARAIFQRGFLQLGYTYFGSLGSMLGGFIFTGFRMALMWWRTLLRWWTPSMCG